MKKLFLLFIQIFLVYFSISCQDSTTNPSPPPPSFTEEKTFLGNDFILHGRPDDVGLQNNNYERLPSSLMSSTDSDIVKLKGLGLHLDTAGYYIAFETDATNISLTAKLRKNSSYGNIENENESAFQLLIFENNTWTDAKANIVPVNNSGSQETTLNYENISKKSKKYMLLFPTYNGVTKSNDFKLTIKWFSIMNQIEPFNESKEKPFLIYGTSVTQGASGSSPIKNYTQIVSLERKREVINMGFSGSAYCGNDMADYLAKIPSYMFFIDPTLNLGNITETLAKNNISNMINVYRKAYPTTPIILISQFDKRITGDTEGTWGEWVKTVYDELKDNDENLYFVSRKTGIDLDDTSTVDTVHPNDKGMEMWANKYLTIITEIEQN